MYETDREVVLAVGPSGLYFRLVRPKRVSCSKCRAIPKAFFNTPGSEYDHSSDILDLKSSAAAGCHLCTLLCRSLDEGIQSSIVSETSAGAHGKIELVYEVKTFPYGSKWDMIVPLHHRRGSSSGTLVASGAYLRFEHVAEPGYDDYIDDSAASESSFFMVREMIRECVNDHVECRSALENPNFLPTRLLSVGSSTRPHLKLVTTAKTQVADDRYLTLSHSWGNMTKDEKMKMTTTTATLPSRHAGISEKSLSKTFQEFIYVARTLGVPYVWIDSLCIIQESAEDWNREVAMMAKVYSHSLCTIAADASADGHGGLFLPRNPLECQNCDFREFEGNGMGSQRLINIFPPRLNWDEIVEREFLSTRGWTLQERLLSPRIVHYATREIVWECRKYQKSEQMHRMDVNGPYPAMDSARIFDDRGFGPEAIDFKRWYSLVDDYSRRSFTEESDRLLALSGLAREVQRQKGWRYLAGMWEQDFNIALRWQLNRHQMKTHHRPKNFRAPSWSWASIEGHLQHWDPEVLPSNPENPRHFPGEPKILSVNVETAAGDPFGQVLGGVLRLRGLVKQATVEQKADEYHIPEIGAESRGRSAGLVFDAVEEERAGPYLLLLMNLGRKERIPILEALALVPSGGGQYRRVGWVIGIGQGFFDGSEETTVAIA